jgi:hypothetical protein
MFLLASKTMRQKMDSDESKGKVRFKEVSFLMNIILTGSPIELEYALCPVPAGTRLVLLLLANRVYGFERWAQDFGDSFYFKTLNIYIIR